MSTQLDRDRLRREVQKEMERQKRISALVFWIIHFIFAIVTLAVVWGVGLSNPTIAQAMGDNSKNNPLPLLLIFPTILAFLGVFFHGMAALISSGKMNSAIKQQVITNVLSRELLGDAADLLGEVKEKRKHSPVRLSEEGELVFEDEQDVPPEETPQVMQKGES